MSRKTSLLLIVLSVALNIGFAGIWAAQTTARYCAGRKECGHGGCNGAVWCPLHRRLAVTDGQWRTMESRMTEFRQGSQALCKEINSRRAEMIDLIASAQADRAAIAAKQEEILAGHRRMQDLVIQQLLAEKEVLTVEQQKELFDMIRQRCGCMGLRQALMQDDSGELNQMPSGVHPGTADNDNP
jgi:Spy/CpxP family protein refolding chaperone